MCSSTTSCSSPSNWSGRSISYQAIKGEWCTAPQPDDCSSVCRYIDGTGGQFLDLLYLYIACAVSCAVFFFSLWRRFPRRRSVSGISRIAEGHIPPAAKASRVKRGPLHITLSILAASRASHSFSVFPHIPSNRRSYSRA